MKNIKNLLDSLLKKKNSKASPALEDETEIVETPTGSSKKSTSSGTQTSVPRPMKYEKPEKKDQKKRYSLLLLLLLLFIGGVWFLNDSGDSGDELDDIGGDFVEDTAEEFERVKEEMLKKRNATSGKESKNQKENKDSPSTTSSGSADQNAKAGSNKGQKKSSKKQLSEEEILAQELADSEKLDARQRQNLDRRYKIDESSGKSLEINDLNQKDSNSELLSVSSASDLDNGKNLPDDQLLIDLALEDLEVEDNAKDKTVLADSSEKQTEKMRKEAGIEKKKVPVKAGDVPKSYVSPPNYLNKGRGLTYNCKEKHWACLEKTEYRKCQKNHAYNQFHKKDIECYPSEVLKTVDDCARMQLKKVYRAPTTDFCR